jgi:tRNA threonylcarbamoyladenosine biosynthesis protein TsaB
VLILSVDTSSRGGSVAVLRDEAVLGVVSTWGDEAYSSRIFRQWELLLGELKLKLEEFDVFAVGSGPGSFTGLRVGLAAAKAWGEAYGRPVVGVSVLEAVARQCDFPAEVLVPAIDARRGQFYAAKYRRKSEGVAALQAGAVTDGLALESSECVFTVDELTEVASALAHDTGVNGVAVVTPEPTILGSALARTGTVHVLRASNVLAPWIGQIAFERASKGEVGDALTLDANYVRRSDAEVDAKGR